MPYTKDPDDLAETLAAMTYGDLMDVARSLHDMADDKDTWPLKTPEDFASLLWGWSETYRDAAAEQAAEADAP